MRNRQVLSVSLPVLISLVLASQCPPLAMAVDRSKFRTCEQTSFCKRHRSARSKPAFDYAILPDSIHVHHPVPPLQEQDQGDNADAVPVPVPVPVPPGDSQSQASLGYYQKIKRLLQSKQQDDEKDQIDPYYKGCEPFFTATLLNRSNKSYYPRHSSSSSLPEDADIVQERLDLFLYLHQDGVARMRITEQYTPPDTAADNSNRNSNSKGTSNNDGNSNGNSDGDKPNNSNPYSKARWTSDELILNHEEIQGVDGDQVKILPFGEIKPLLEHIPANDNDMVTEDNYIAFEYGNLVGGIGGGDDKNKDNDGHMNAILLVQFQPFAIHMWRTNMDGGDSNHAVLNAPIVSFNSEQMMHFEVRRDKHDADTDTDMHESHADEDHQGGDGEGGDENDVDANEDIQPQHEKDKHGGKEIVGYWEDGLAIYADGSREEKIVNSNDASLPKTEAPTDGFQVDTNGMWEEKFGDHRDSKPHGPTSIGADITFPSSTYLYGLPEHASSMQLKDTIGDNAHYKEPYRLYNLDVFEYELDESMALYGEVPLIISQSATAGTAGVFWFNPTETFVDVETSKVEKKGTKTHWISESGIIDLFFLPGPDPRTIYEQYARLTGRMELPPMFSLGYHQCRWNYRDEDDVYQVHEKFEELDYPYDVLWLDIEHTDDKRYFTWDNNQFPNPIAMQDKLSGQGRKMVTIIDPHIKRDDRYYIHKEATAKGLYIKDKSGKKDYDGWCWPGSSSYLDFTSEKVRSWWADQFAYNRYSGSTPSLYTWNDMNEPSVFNGPEVSMQKDLKNLEGVEHREWHNLYGILFQKATAEGLIRRNKGENIRPFVLSRSFYASSQRYGAIWTGDNESSWEHLKIAAPMLLSLNIAALSFVGADVGGFFGNPDAELMTRWMQAGAYQPFFRGHAHHDAKRREPWMFGNEWMVRMRRAAMARYALLPYWYTVFREASVTGMPVMRAMWMEYPEIEELYSVDDQFLIGADLLVKPVTSPEQTTTQITFPAKDNWYDVDSMTAIATKMPTKETKSLTVTVESDIDKIPVYQRGGSIIARKLRLRRSTQMMTDDPYTLYVALDNDQKASGIIYMDDENTFDHERKDYYAVANISVDMNGVIQCQVDGNDEWIASQPSSARMIERIVIMGLALAPSNMYADSRPLDFDYSAERGVLVIRKPELSALSTWKISLA